MARITVEDCLENVPNRFALVMLVTKRAKQLLKGAPSTLNNPSRNKKIVTSLREVSKGTVKFENLTNEKAQEDIENYLRR